MNAKKTDVNPVATDKTKGSGNGGLWLTRQNKTTLRRLAGQGGAFTIDTMPATAGQSLPWWDVAASGPDGLGADWDIAP